MKGGRIKANNNGTFYGINATGRADAEFLNILGIRWYGNGNPDLINLYRYPDLLVNGFNLSMNDAINRNSTLNIFTYLDNILKARESDAVFHKEERGNEVDDKHAYVYGLTKWLRHHYVPSLLPFTHEEFKYRDPREDEHYINVYSTEFINNYEQYVPQNPLTPAAAARASNVVSIWRNFVINTQDFRNLATAGGRKNRSKIRTRKNIMRKRVKRNTKTKRRMSKKYRKSHKKNNIYQNT